MPNIKLIDRYIFKSFIVLFFATFFVCLFIVVMQFVWLHVDELIGKGIPLWVLARFFYYACLTSTPIALPLAILLASLMTFGNLGERLELLSMKTAGISLFRIMRSLLIFISFLVVGAFFFSNNVIPIAQQKMWVLMFSFRQKSPELEIPVGEFYSGIRGWNIYARSKDTKHKALCDVMIYDFSNGFENANVTTADTLRIATTADKKNLIISLTNGEYFENLKSQTKSRDNTPYRRETFQTKDILIDFDTNFEELSGDIFQNQHISKNIQKLTHDIDSINFVRDSLKDTYAENIVENKLFGNTYQPTYIEKKDSLPIAFSQTTRNTDSLFLISSQEQMKQIANTAVMKMQNTVSDVQYNTIVINEADNYYVRHNIEWHRKFTLSFACLIFFFIGAPLGAIIGKGGLGMPAVVSIVLFIIYYIIDTYGQKMGRENVWSVWQGMWLSSSILLPVGIFLTYKAATDSEMFRNETYLSFFKKAYKFFKTDLHALITNKGTKQIV
ncbi:MAG: LptF/LptG family permease [Prevotellaceae bacterium]|jgi:lipopolysaccharide export system permease protein|nr:LptF/LptG family permease [Prevotellaceae bacterium]